jgi:arylsulfatase A
MKVMHSTAFAVMRSLGAAFCFLLLPQTFAARQPNIVFIIADDLGYGDVGCYGQKKIRTPNIDRLASEGMRFTQHYSGNAVCAPSRCVLMTGLHPGHAFVRNNRELKPEGQTPLPANTVTLAKLLKGQGYVTGAFGKWGLGGPGTSGDPLNQGFDQFFGYNCQRLAHNYYPTSLWDNSRRLLLNNPDFSAHQKLAPGADPTNAASYAQFTGQDYAPDLIGERAIRFMREHHDQPFFLFFPTTVPHLALQVPADSLAEYAGKFPEEPYTGAKNYLPHGTPRAAYAAMITRLDGHIGKMMAVVKELGLDENTIFVFTSDNGPLYDKLGGTDTDFFESAGRFRGHKGSLFEGGIRVPCIVRWKNRIRAGAVSDRVTGFEDWMPTFFGLIGKPEAAPKGIDGISFAATLLGHSQEPRAFLYREFAAYGGYQSVRVGNWKAIRQRLNPPNRNVKPEERIELYDLARDPSETTDVSVQQPAVVARLEKILRQQHTPSAEFPIRGLDGN